MSLSKVDLTEFLDCGDCSDCADSGSILAQKINTVIEKVINGDVDYQEEYKGFQIEIDSTKDVKIMN